MSKETKERRREEEKKRRREEEKKREERREKREERREKREEETQKSAPTVAARGNQAASIPALHKRCHVHTSVVGSTGSLVDFSRTLWGPRKDSKET